MSNVKDRIKLFEKKETITKQQHYKENLFDVNYHQIKQLGIIMIFPAIMILIVIMV